MSRVEVNRIAYAKESAKSVSPAPLMPPRPETGRVASPRRPLRGKDDHPPETVSSESCPYRTSQGLLFDKMNSDVHIVHMKEISIRDLHLNTGEWIRKVNFEQKIVITERGRPVATLVPFQSADKAISFRHRRLVQGFAKLPPIQDDSTQSISADRDRA